MSLLHACLPFDIGEKHTHTLMIAARYRSSGTDDSESQDLTLVQDKKLTFNACIFNLVSLIIVNIELVVGGILWLNSASLSLFLILYPASQISLTHLRQLKNQLQAAGANPAIQISLALTELRFNVVFRGTRSHTF